MDDVEKSVFLTSAIDGVWSASRPGRITPTERIPGKHLTRGWVGPRTGMDDVEKSKNLPLLVLELRPLCRSARGQSLYRLRYPGSKKTELFINTICVAVPAFLTPT
jgi:hypothetical protein